MSNEQIITIESTSLKSVISQLIAAYNSYPEDDKEYIIAKFSESEITLSSQSKVLTDEQPYLTKTTFCLRTEKVYNPNYGDSRVCKCGHSYGRHFDSYDNMEACGCKYCSCYDFVEESRSIEEINECVETFKDAIRARTGVQIISTHDDSHAHVFKLNVPMVIAVLSIHDEQYDFYAAHTMNDVYSLIDTDRNKVYTVYDTVSQQVIDIDESKVKPYQERTRMFL